MSAAPRNRRSNRLAACSSRLIRDASNGEFDIVIVHSLDRWARNVGVQSRTLAEPAARLFEDVGKLWSMATSDERSKLIGPLLDHVYVEIEARQTATISPTPACKHLIDRAVEQNPDAWCVIVGTEPKLQDEDWPIWRRRGRVELPVQNESRFSTI